MIVFIVYKVARTACLSTSNSCICQVRWVSMHFEKAKALCNWKSKESDLIYFYVEKLLGKLLEAVNCSVLRTTSNAPGVSWFFLFFFFCRFWWVGLFLQLLSSTLSIGVLFLSHLTAESKILSKYSHFPVVSLAAKLLKNKTQSKTKIVFSILHYPLPAIRLQ